MNYIKKPYQIELLARSGHIAKIIVDQLERLVRVGNSPLDIENLANELILKHGVKSAFKGYDEYPCVTCISVNSTLVHAIPTSTRFKTGDVVSIDFGVNYKNWNSDIASTTIVDANNTIVEDKIINFVSTIKRSLDESIKLIKPGVPFGDVQFSIQSIIENAGYGVIRDLTGHGVGRTIHEPPSFPNFGKKGEGPLFEEGMVIAIEPMASMGDWKIKHDSDSWGISIKDGSLGAHFEYTIAVTKDGYRNLTS